MELNELLKTVPKSKIIDSVLEIYSEQTEENKKNHIDKFKNELVVLNKMISQYFFLSHVIRSSNEKDRFPGRFFFSKHYVSAIGNNFYIIKELFLKGFHVQLQLFLRTQFEYTNNLIAFIGSDDFFQQFGTDNGNTDSIISPKPIHAEKAIRMLFNEYTNNDPNNVWNLFKTIMESIYKDLSESAHGNIPRVAFHSLSSIENQKDCYGSNICGVKSPLPATISILRQSLNYFQIAFRLVWIQLEKKCMIDSDSPFLELVEYFNDKAQLLNHEE